MHTDGQRMEIEYSASTRTPEEIVCLEEQARLLEEGGAFGLEQWAGFWEEEGPGAVQAGWGVHGACLEDRWSLTPEQG